MNLQWSEAGGKESSVPTGVAEDMAAAPGDCVQGSREVVEYSPVPPLALLGCDDGSSSRESPSWYLFTKSLSRVYQPEEASVACLVQEYTRKANSFKNE